MRMQQNLAILLVLFSGMMVSVLGCNPTVEATLPVSKEATLPVSPILPAKSVLATPTLDADIPAISLTAALPSPPSGLATVGGVILDNSTKRPPLEGTVYLASIQEMDNGNPVVVLDKDMDPFAIPMDNGQFIFSEVHPNKYGFVLYTPDFSFLIDDPKTGESLMVDILPDQVLDLGTIEVSIP